MISWWRTSKSLPGFVLMVNGLGQELEWHILRIEGDKLVKAG